MKLPALNTPEMLEPLLRPETPLEQHLLHLPDFQDGLLWGEPRFGHPEGKVGLHVRDVLDNIDRIPDVAPDDRRRLRLIALAHDTFKYREDRGRPRDWERHHGRLAARFMEQFTDDRVILDIIDQHDDAFYAWLHARHGFSWSGGRVMTLDALLDRLGHCLQLYYLFFKCDTQTGDKTQAPLKWFEQSVGAINLVILE